MNDAIEAEVIKRLPATYGQLCAALGTKEDRKIDAALQRLKRRGKIEFERRGRLTIWSLKSERRFMNKDEFYATLAEFFRHSFLEDPAGVGEWLEQFGQDVDAFVAELDRSHPAREE